MKCWIATIGGFCVGLVIFFAATSFPTHAVESSSISPGDWSTKYNATMNKLVETSVLFTESLWVLSATILVLVCLGLVTIMLCGMSAENIARLLSVLAFLFMIGVSALFYFRPDLLEKVIIFIKDLGFWGYLLMGFSFLVVSFPLTIGCVVLALCCGFIYGLVLGSVIACVGLFVGGVLAYYVCAKLLRKPVLRYARPKPKFNAILRALQENAWYVSVALRVSPVPLGLQNGLLAVTVPFHVYMGSLPFAFPEQILFAYFGHEANQLMDVLSGKASLHTGQVWLMVFDVVVGLGLFVACVIFGRRIINKAMSGVEPLDPAMSSSSSSDEKDEV